MEGNGKLLTIPEAAELFNIDTTTLYKRLKKGHLNSVEIQVKSRSIKKIKESDLIAIYGKPVKSFQVKSGEFQVKSSDVQVKSGEFQVTSGDVQVKSGEFQVMSGDSQVTSSEFQVTSGEFIRSQVKAVMEEFFEAKQTQMMKPLEEQAIYRAGELNKENQFLKARLETLVEENNTLRGAIKALPGPVEQIVEQMKEKDIAIITLEQEKHALQTDLQKTEEDKARALKEKLEKENIIQEKEATIQQTAETLKNVQTEKERELHELKTKLEAEAKEKHDLKIHLQEKEKEQSIIVEAWKKRLEEAEKPWWRKIFG